MDAAELLSRYIELREKQKRWREFPHTDYLQQSWFEFNQAVDKWNAERTFTDNIVHDCSERKTPQ